MTFKFVVAKKKNLKKYTIKKNSSEKDIHNSTFDIITSQYNVHYKLIKEVIQRMSTWQSEEQNSRRGECDSRTIR